MFRGGEGERTDGYSVNWHVAIDDTHHWKYTFTFRRDAPINHAETAGARADAGPDYHLIRNKANRYLQNREQMQEDTFIGMDMAFQVHDTCATEGAGPIQDRTQEHLTQGDIALVTARKLMLTAIQDVQAGRDPRHVVRDPAANRFPDLVVRSSIIPRGRDHRTFWKTEPRELAPA
jgi:hypothetical protein